MIAEGIPTQGDLIIGPGFKARIGEKEMIVKGVNMDQGTGNIIKASSIRIPFQTSFSRIPRVTLTLRDTSPLATNPFVKDVSLTDFTVSFAQSLTCEFDWIAIERD
jgi:hypothetical protein